MEGKLGTSLGVLDEPLLLVNSRIDGFAAGRSSLADVAHLEATFQFEDNLIESASIPQGSVLIHGNLSPGTKKQQGVTVSIDSSEFGLVIDLMMKANPKRTIAAIASALSTCSQKWPERHWDALGD